MNRHFYVLKAGVLVLAIAAAGLTTGFQMDKLSSRFDSVHYSASVYAGVATHKLTHAASHFIGEAIDRLSGR